MSVSDLLDPTQDFSTQAFVRDQAMTVEPRLGGAEASW